MRGVVEACVGRYSDLPIIHSTLGEATSPELRFGLSSVSLGFWPFVPGCLVQGVSSNPDVPLRYGQRLHVAGSDGELAPRVGRLRRPCPA